MAHTEKKHFEVLDGLRGVAALAVVVFHYMEWVAPDSSRNFIGHGFLAVDFFFCLSGFVIAYAYDDRIKELGLREFFRSRLIRLHPLVIFGSVLGLLGYLFNPFGGVEAGFLRNAEIFVSSVLLIPFPVMLSRAYNLFGLNAPAWSLFFEYVANIAYAFLLLPVRRGLLSFLVIVSAAGICFVIYRENSLLGGWSGPTFWDGFVRVSFSFLAGLFIWRSGWIVKNRLGFLPLAALLTLAFLVRFSRWNLLTESLIVLLYFPLMIVLGAGATPAAGVRRLCIFLGKISYPLYMTHYWLIWIFGDYYTRHHPAGLRLLGIVGVGVLFQVLLAYGSMVFDIPVRRRLLGSRIVR
jgi:peptidoglycan/LPS O-acetylase OafA/YrhL